MNPATFQPDREFARAAGWTALIAAAVCLFIVTMLVLSVRDERRLQPFDSPQLTVMKERLLERPNDESLKTYIRDRDQALRQGFFARRAFAAQGAWLLVVSAGALVIALKSYAVLTRRPDTLRIQLRDPFAENRLARWGVGASGVLIAGVAGVLILRPQPAVPLPAAETVLATPPASPEELAANYVSFRGINGNGHIAPMALPEKWDAASGQGVLWKSPIPLPGHSSPILFSDCLFITGADEEKQALFCYAAATGELRWQSPVPRSSLQKLSVFEDTGHAAATPVTDGVRVYAIFAGGDIAAFDYSGKKLWSRGLGTPESTYGYAASLALVDGKVIVQWDNASDAESGKSFLLCLDGVTGKTLWKTPRPVCNSWASPIVVGQTIYTCSNPYVIAYRAADGGEIWRAKLMDGDVAITPVFQDGILYVANDRAIAAAIRTDGAGDVTATHVLWTNKEATLPDMVSPLADGKRLLLAHRSGEATCLNAADGQILWKHSFETQMIASPILVNGKVYLISKEGDCFLFPLEGTFTLQATNKLGEEVAASPIAVGGRLYVRAKEHLYCIGTK